MTKAQTIGGDGWRSNLHKHHGCEDIDLVLPDFSAPLPQTTRAVIANLVKRPS